MKDLFFIKRKFQRFRRQMALLRGCPLKGSAGFPEQTPASELIILLILHNLLCNLCVHSAFKYKCCCEKSLFL